MNIVKYHFIITFCLILGWITAAAQTYPVQLSTVVLPPYSVHLSDYTTSEKLAVNVLFNDPVRFELSVKLKVTIEGKNITLSTKPEFNPRPIYLQSGFPERLTGIDLAPYFDPRNLNFQGLDRRTFEQKGALPEGVYRICIEVWEYSQNKKVSNTGCSTVWMILNDPPIINYPKNGEKIKILDPQLVIFNWTPRHTGSPNSAFSTEYEFELVEVRVANQNPNNAILTSPPIFTTTTHSTSIYYSIAETPLIPGQRYAFRVRAKGIAGVDELDLFKNNGYSEVFAFTYGDQCLTPDAIQLESLNPTSLKASWIALPAHTSFAIRYKENKAGSEWFEKSSMVPEFTITGLRPETEYAVQVVGVCGVVAHEEVKTYTVKTKKVEESNFACGSTEDKIDLSKSTLIKSLSPGQFIESSNFKIALVEVSNTGDGFSGRGIAYIPWFKLAGLKVEFKNIQVNEDHKVIRGNVVSTKSANSNWVYTSTGSGTGDPENGAGNNNTDSGNTTGNGSGTDTTSNIVIVANDPVITVDSTTGNTVITDDKGQVTIVRPGEQVTLVDSEGNTQVIAGGSATAGGSSNQAGNNAGSSGSNGGGTATNQAFSEEEIKLLKQAIAKVRNAVDFTKMKGIKEDLKMATFNLKGALEMERNEVVRNTNSAGASSSSRDIILIAEEEIAEISGNPWGSSKFIAYKEKEREYNALKILDVICNTDLKTTELSLLAGKLVVDGEGLSVYLSKSKEGNVPAVDIVKEIAQSIVVWSVSGIIKEN